MLLDWLNTASNWTIGLAKSEIFKLVLLPCALPCIAYIVYVLQKNREYKFDFYKKVIENRMIAHDLVQQILVETSGLSEDKTDQKYLLTLFHTSRRDEVYQRKLEIGSTLEMSATDCYLHYPNDSYGFEYFRRLIKITLSKKVWLSNEMIGFLENMESHCNELISEANPSNGLGAPTVPKKTLLDLAKDYHSALIFTRRNIESQMYRDVKNLHKVPCFLKSKLKYSSKEIYYSHTPYNKLFPEIRQKCI